MPKKVLIITGSPRKDSNTKALVNAFVHGTVAAGNQVEIFDAAAANLDGCHGDASCHQRGHCGLQDDGVKVHELMCWADVLVLAPPEHPKRLLHPLKNVGKRGEQKWVEISWEQALDEIAEKLERVIDNYGPEAIAVSVQQVNTGDDLGMLRRFMNLIGTPNWISGLHLCYGNTIQVHRATFGHYCTCDYGKADCIVLVGHTPHENNWAGEAAALVDAMGRGAKLIVLDPRKSENAKRAHLHLPLRYGTDAAMLLGFLNVIIEENLYDTYRRDDRITVAQTEDRIHPLFGVCPSKILPHLEHLIQEKTTE